MLSLNRDWKFSADKALIHMSVRAEASAQIKYKRSEFSQCWEKKKGKGGKTFYARKQYGDKRRE